MAKDAGGGPTFRAVILIPGTVNYFYNQSGRRIGEALQSLGGQVDICTLAECTRKEYDWCIFSNITEVLHAFGSLEAGIERVRALMIHWKRAASCAIDCVRTIWYDKIHQLCKQCGVELVLDLGLLDQGRYLAPEYRESYRFVFSGLTPTELLVLEELPQRDGPRVFPWAFVGHKTAYRAALVDHLVQSVDPGGFLYMPAPAPYTEKGSPHLNQEQFEKVLQHVRYQVWCSHHHHFYMEPERFRMSLLTGSVPIKIVDMSEDVPAEAPFSYLMMEAGMVGERLRCGSFPQVRSRYWWEWKRMPPLSEGLAHVMGMHAHGKEQPARLAA